MFGDSIRRLERRDGDVGGGDHAGSIDVTTEQGGRLVADQVLLAFGRTPNTTSLGLDRAGVKTGADGAIIVDANSRTNIPNIYAVGDVSNQFNLTPVAIREGHAFADSVFGKKAWQVDYSNVPTAVFSSPEIGTVGLTELEARAQYLAVDVYKVRFRPLTAAVTGDCEASLLKVVVDSESDRILGIHIFAHEGQRVDPGARDRHRQRSNHERLHVGHGGASNSWRGDRRNAYADRALRSARRRRTTPLKRRCLIQPQLARKDPLGAPRDVELPKC
jgi:glutathione reductase (NADPH)